MADRGISWRPVFKAGASFLKKLILPASAGDPAGVVDQELWIQTTAGKLAFRLAGSTILVPLASELPGAGLSQEQIEDFMALMIQDNSDIDWTYTDNGAAAGTLVGVIKPDSITYAKIQNVSAQARVLGRAAGAGAGDITELDAAALLAILGPLDAATLGGQTSAAIQAAVVNTISNGAGAAYDTLVELQALLVGDAASIAALVASVSLRARFIDMAIPNGAPTGSIVHAMALGNIGSWTARTYIAASGINEEYEVTPVDGNEVTVSDETGGNIPAGRRIFMTFGV
jgi:hypothetical protein